MLGENVRQSAATAFTNPLRALRCRLRGTAVGATAEGPKVRQNRCSANDSSTPAGATDATGDSYCGSAMGVGEADSTTRPNRSQTVCRPRFFRDFPNAGNRATSRGVLPRTYGHDRWEEVTPDQPWGRRGLGSRRFCISDRCGRARWELALPPVAFSSPARPGASPVSRPGARTLDGTALARHRSAPP